MYNFDSPFKKEWEEQLKWLDETIQRNYTNDGRPFNKSTVAQFLEWRSMDKETWKFRIQGLPPTLIVTFKDPEHEFLYNLRWR